MKTTIKLLGITLALVTAFAMISCSEDEPEPEVKTDAVRPLITVDPLNAVYLPGATVTPLSVTASASDGGALSYQWYSETTMYSNPTAVTGATSATFTPPATTAGTLYYYAEVTNTNNGVNGTKTAVQTSNRAKFVVGWEKVDNFGGFIGSFTARSIIFANNRFVAVGGFIAAGGQIGWSDDGINWTKVESTPFGTSIIYGIAYGNNKFIAVGEGGKMASSTDGKTWTSVDASASAVFGTADINDIAYGNNRFLAVGDAGKDGYLADDSLTWTSSSSSAYKPTTNIRRIVYCKYFMSYVLNKPQYAIFNTNSWTGGLLMSNFGEHTWETGTINDLVSADNYIVAVGTGGNVYQLKPDYDMTTSGVNISPSSVLGTNTINKAAYGANKLLVFSSSSSKGAWSSDNGTTWTEVPYVNMSRMAYGAGRFVAVAEGDGISYSKYP